MSLNFSLFHYLKDSSNIVLMLCSYESYLKVNKRNNGLFDSFSKYWVGFSFVGIWKLVKVGKCLKFDPNWNIFLFIKNNI